MVYFFHFNFAMLVFSKSGLTSKSLQSTVTAGPVERVITCVLVGMSVGAGQLFLKANVGRLFNTKGAEPHDITYRMLFGLLECRQMCAKHMGVKREGALNVMKNGAEAQESISHFCLYTCAWQTIRPSLKAWEVRMSFSFRLWDGPCL